MSWVWKGIPVPTLVALGLLILGGLLHIIGLATPYWHTDTIRNAVVTNLQHGHGGLWATCTVAGADTFQCTEHEEIQGYIQATRAMAILALLFGAICIVITGLWHFLSLEKYNLICMIGSLLSGFLAGLFGIIGIIIYAAEVDAHKRDTILGQLTERNLSWSFALCTVAAVIAVIATGLIGLGTRMKD